MGATSHDIARVTGTTAWNLPFNVETDSQYAPNPRRYMPVSYDAIALYAASSMHPGGLNVSFGDGSVRFIKETITSWPNTAASFYGAPSNYYIEQTSLSFNPFTVKYTLTFTGAARLGVWQALSTRSNGEVISADSY